MKRTVIIFIIALCLLCFMEISCLASAEELPSSGEAWNMFSVTTKRAFMIGFQGGIAMSFSKVDPIVVGCSADSVEMKVWVELVNLFNFINEHVDAILKVMDDLYKDPANTYIIANSIIEIACQKLKGEDIEPLLQEARKKALLEK